MPVRVFMRKKKGYIFTSKRHSKSAVMAAVLGVISLAGLGVVVFRAYRNDGEAAVGYGFTGLFALLFSLVGLGLGIAAARDKDCYRLFPVPGILLNLAALWSVSLILYAGARL